MKRRKRRTLFAGTLAAVLLLALVPGLFQGLTVRRYSLPVPGFVEGVRLVLLTDLHSCRYGEREAELIAAIRKQAPDLILLGGDIFDDELPDDNTEYLLQGIGALCPCFYVTGNHEYWSGVAGFQAKLALLEQYGVEVLAGETTTLSIRGQSLLLCGVDDPEVSRLPPLGRASFDQQLDAAAAAIGTGGYSILLSHRPEYFQRYCACGFSLVLCGHAHGGQWRIPGILNGLYAPNQGLFPKYAGGKYTSGDTTMIVSRGLARESTPVPRFYNPPELVVVDLKEQPKT